MSVIESIQLIICNPLISQSYELNKRIDNGFILLAAQASLEYMNSYLFIFVVNIFLHFAPKFCMKVGT